MAEVENKAEHNNADTIAAECDDPEKYASIEYSNYFKKHDHGNNKKQLKKFRIL